MNKQIRNLILSAGILLTVFSTGTQAQDWTDGSFTLWNSFGSQGTNDGQFTQADGIAVDENGLIYVSDYQLHRIQVFKADGTFVRKWGTQGSGENQFQNPRGLDIGPDGNLYVCDWGNHRICVYQPDGTFVRTWGSFGAGDGQFNHPYRLSVNGEGQAFVADYNNNRIQVFEANGTFVRQFQTVSVSGGLEVPTAIAATDNGTVFVGQSGRQAVKYDADGVRRIAFVSSQHDLPEEEVRGLHIYAQKNIFYFERDRLLAEFAVFNENATSLATMGPVRCDGYGDPAWALNDFTIAPDLSIAAVGSNGVNIRLFSWLQRTERPAVNKFGCWAKIEEIEQRAGYPYLDIDFRANSDNGITNAQVAMCAFVNGDSSLSNMIPMRTFVGNTGTNLGYSVKLSSDLKRVTWNMAADWSADTGNLQVQVFAQSGPYYLPFNWLTIPSGGGVSNEFQICRTPVTSADLKPVWMFLIAANDPAVELVSGQVYGTGGAYDGLLLEGYVQHNDIVLGIPRTCTVFETTGAGRDFLWERMNLRKPTASELLRAKEGTSPGVQGWAPRYTVDGRPSAVNEFGLDTGASEARDMGFSDSASSFWAVKK